MIPLFKVYSNKVEALRRMGRCMDRGYTGQGPVVEEFEERLAGLYGLEPHQVVTVNSGTSAIMLGLLSVGVKPGDDVVCSPVTCMADPQAIMALGAKVVWADCDPNTGLSHSEHINRALTKKTSAALITDLSGMSAITSDSEVPVVKDAAQNFGVGANGTVVALSFQSIKHLSTGDGGALLMPRWSGLATHRARLTRWFGLDRNASADFRCAQNIKVAGHKWHMTDLAASLGLANLKGALRNVWKSKENASWYEENLPASVRVPVFDWHGSYWTYMILVEKRDAFIDFMRKKGVHCSPVQSIGTRHDLFPKKRLSGAERYSSRNVAIPNGFWVTQKDRQRIADLVHQWVRKNP